MVGVDEFPSGDRPIFKGYACQNNVTVDHMIIKFNKQPLLKRVMIICSLFQGLGMPPIYYI